MMHLVKRVAGSSADLLSKILTDPFRSRETIDPALAEELQITIRQISAETPTGSGMVEDEWDRFRRLLREQFSNSPKAFLRRPPADNLLGLGNAYSAFAALKWMKTLDNWHRYQNVLKEDAIGKPVPFLLQLQSSGVQIHHTFHIANFEAATEKLVGNIPLIVEFGGGYGSFCRQVFRLGFRGIYVIFDLPEMSAVQRYYLKSIGLPVLDARDFQTASSGIILLTQLDQLAAVVRPLHGKRTPGLFVATWSLSEVPRALRELLLEILGGFEHFLIAYQRAFGSVENLEFFEEFVKRQGSPELWKHHPIYGNPNSRYVFR